MTTCLFPSVGSIRIPFENLEITESSGDDIREQI